MWVVVTRGGYNADWWIIDGWDHPQSKKTRMRRLNRTSEEEAQRVVRGRGLRGSVKRLVSVFRFSPIPVGRGEWKRVGRNSHSRASPVNFWSLSVRRNNKSYILWTRLWVVTVSLVSLQDERVLRSSINSRERRRMHDLNEAMEDLRSTLPYSAENQSASNGNTAQSGKRMSKISTLILAANWSAFLNWSKKSRKQDNSLETSPVKRIKKWKKENESFDEEQLFCSFISFLSRKNM